jgi:hypothetical protein
LPWEKLERIDMGIHLNCKEATLLVEKRQDERIGMVSSLKLNFHFFICKACSAYNKQSTIISQLLKRGFESNANSTDEEALKAQIKSKLDL